VRTTGERNACRPSVGHARCFAQAGDRGNAAPVSKESQQVAQARASVRDCIEAALAEMSHEWGRGAQWLIWSWGVQGGACAASTRTTNAGRVAAVLNMLQGLMQWLAPLMQILCAGGRRLATAGGRWTEGGRASGTAWPHRRGQVPAHGPLRRCVPGLDRFDAFAASVARGPAGLRRRAAVQHGLFRSSPAEPSRPDG
jgi:hypothetical protein